MAVCQEASFAPVLAVLPVDSVEEAIAASSQCDYHLGASVFTRDPASGVAIAQRLKTGSVCINDVIAPTAHPGTPFGGTGASGWGVTQGAEGLLEMTVPQVVSIRSGAWRPHYDPPGTTSFTNEKVLAAMLRSQHGAGLAIRTRGLWEMLRGLGK
jgi:aldehyde dehydrogenase (NAD+)